MVTVTWSLSHGQHDTVIKAQALEGTAAQLQQTRQFDVKLVSN